MPHEDDRPPLSRHRLGRHTAQDLRAPDLDERRRLAAKEDRHGLRLGEVLSVEGQHLRRLRVRFREHVSGAVALGGLCCAVGREVLDDAREGRDGFRRDGERTGLGRVLVVEEHGRDVEVIPHLV